MNVQLNNKEQLLFRDCIEVYGLQRQLDQYIEECLEGGLAARKYIRALETGDESKIIEAKKELLGELVDTSIMSQQIKQHFILVDINNDIPYEDSSWAFIDRTHEHKINRQIQRVANRKTF